MNIEDRQAHLEWCEQRALKLCDNCDDPDSAIDEAQVLVEQGLISYQELMSYLRPATAEEIAQYEAAQSAQNAKIQAMRRAWEIATSITADSGAIAPEFALHPIGTQIILRVMGKPHQMIVAEESDLEEPKLWSLLYVGRDGNVGNLWNGCWIPLTPELNEEIKSLCEVLVP